VESTGRTDLHVGIDEEGRRTITRSDFSAAFGDWDVLADEIEERRAEPPGSRGTARLDADILEALKAAERAPGELSEKHALALIHADGADLDALCELADRVRQDAVGDAVTYVVNRNLNFSNVCYVGCRFCAFAQRATDADAYRLSLDEVGARVAQAWAVGATEICMQAGSIRVCPATSTWTWPGRRSGQAPTFICTLSRRWR
jgi:FO synthase